MKRLLSLILISAIGTHAFAQIEKGRIIIFSGTDLTMAFGKSVFENAGINISDSKSRNISVSFGAGAFVANNIAIGIEVPIENSYLAIDNDVEAQSSYGIMPFSRAYLSQSNFNPFISLGVGYIHISNLPNFLEANLYNGIMIEGGLGFTAFISENIGFDCQLLYGYSQMKNSEDSNLKLKVKALGIQVGFSIVL